MLVFWRTFGLGLEDMIPSALFSASYPGRISQLQVPPVDVEQARLWKHSPRAELRGCDRYRSLQALGGLKVLDQQAPVLRTRQAT